MKDFYFGCYNSIRYLALKKTKPDSLICRGYRDSTLQK